MVYYTFLYIKWEYKISRVSHLIREVMLPSSYRKPGRGDVPVESQKETPYKRSNSVGHRLKCRAQRDPTIF